MNLLITILLGSIQGITEFVPVSSSGHLVILHDIFPVELINSLGFDVALHLGTLIALIIYFYSDISKYLKAFISSFTNWDVKNNVEQKLAWLLVLSTIPAIIVALLFDNIIESSLRSPIVVATTLLIGALLFFLVEKYSKQNKSITNITCKKTVLLGLAQALALIPGTSRSGITITMGMALNLSREAATRFSFLMAIPIVFLAGTKKSYNIIQEGLVQEQIVLYAIGLLVSTIIGYLAIKYFLQFTKNHNLNWFGLYRIILAIIILIVLV